MSRAKPPAPPRAGRKKSRRPGHAVSAAAAAINRRADGGAKPGILLYGIGNPGRRDDGLGVELARRAGTLNLDNLDCDSDYQLNIEDAETISHYDVVVFVDAAFDLDNPFEFKEIEPARKAAFTTHELGPEGVLALCLELFAASPKAFVLAVRGYRFEAREGITRKAEKNLNLALDFLAGFLDRL